MVDYRARLELSPPYGTTPIPLNREAFQGTEKSRHRVYNNQALHYPALEQSNHDN
jgi:hypothetical protein